ncbi:MAG TPA: Holliday junction resolvase RuvX [Porphyromonadaceae bacterium]|nr:Holliday junction resolvase RuvX [Porphyromonadaceae bacterium]
MGRILAIDYGKKRIGIAVSDPLKIIAGGLGTWSPQEVIPFLQDYVKKEVVECFVLGLPKQTNGLPSENLQRTEEFSKVLRRTFTNIPVVFVDERYTSTLAHRAMIEGGLKKKERQNKALVDEISATIILQTYLEYNK